MNFQAVCRGLWTDTFPNRLSPHLPNFNWWGNLESMKGRVWGRSPLTVMSLVFTGSWTSWTCACHLLQKHFPGGTFFSEVYITWAPAIQYSPVKKEPAKHLLWVWSLQYAGGGVFYQITNLTHWTSSFGISWRFVVCYLDMSWNMDGTAFSQIMPISMAYYSATLFIKPIFVFLIH